MPSKTRKTCPATSFGRAHPLKIRFLTLALASVAPLAQGQTPATQFDAAVAFGARPSVSALRLSPDGKRVAYVAAAAGQGAVLFIRGLERGASPKALTRIDGKNGRLAGCTWVADDRLVCEIYGATYNPALGALALDPSRGARCGRRQPQAAEHRAELLQPRTAIRWR